MRAWTLILGLPLFGCGGGDASIGMNDSGNPQEDGSNGGPDANQSDGSQSSDSGGQDSGQDGNPNPGNDAGMDSGVLDSGTCVPKVFNFQCLQQTCQLGEGQYCANIQQGGCTAIPLACKCDYSCKCLLANIPKNYCGGMIVPKCVVGGSGQLQINCF